MSRVDLAVSELVARVRLALAEAADAAKAPDMQRYMKSSLPFRGITAAPMRKVCNEVFSAHRLPDEASWRVATTVLHDQAVYREERYAAVELTGHRYYRAYQHPGVLDLYEHLVVAGAWWDLVDPVAGNRVGPILRAFPYEVTPVIRRWAVDDDMWLRRTAILCQLGSKDATDLDLLRHVLEENLAGSRHGHEFFVRKAVGWALRQQARQGPDWVRDFVEQHRDRMAGLSCREALKHLP